MRRQRGGVGIVFAGVAFLLTAGTAAAVITRLTPLREVLNSEQLIFTVRVERVDPDRPAVVFVVEEDLKGKAPFRRLPVNLTADGEGQKAGDTAKLLKRLAPKQTLVFFSSGRGKRYTAFGYTQGTWFQLLGQVEQDPAQVRWSFLHCEPYLRRTFRGTTEELIQVVRDGLSGKKQPPEPDAKVEPGLGPEVPGADAPRKSGGGPLFAVIPVLVGPLALLGMLFPAVFGGAVAALWRWKALLTVASVNSLLYLAHLAALTWSGRWARASWWGTAQALWAAMTLVTLLGTLAAWRRHLVALHATQGAPAAELAAGPRRKEHVVLWVLSLGSLAALAYGLARNQPLLEMPWNVTLVLGAGLWIGTFYALYLRNTRTPARAVPTVEGLILAAMVAAFVAVGAAGWGPPVGPPGPAAVAGEGEKSVAILWRFEPEERGSIFATPLVAGERVYVAAAHTQGFNRFGTLYCLDRATGKKLWAFDDGGAMKSAFSSPCLAHGRVYVGEGFHEDRGCKLFCLSADTGAKLWEFATASHTESSPVVADGRVVFGAGDDGVIAVDAASGKEVWRYAAGVHVDANPAVAGGRVYVGSGVGDLHRDPAVFCLDLATGQPLWRVPVELPAWAQAAVAGDRVYFGLGNGNYLQSDARPAGAVLCLEAATGRRLWRRPFEDAVLGRPAASAEHLYVGSRNGKIYALNPADGSPVWEQSLGGAVVASPAVSGPDLIALGSAGQVGCLRRDTGTVAWSVDVARQTQARPLLLSSPVVAEEGSRRRVYFGAELTAGLAPAAGLFCLEEAGYLPR